MEIRLCIHYYSAHFGDIQVSTVKYSELNVEYSVMDLSTVRCD